MYISVWQVSSDLAPIFMVHWSVLSFCVFFFQIVKAVTYIVQPGIILWNDCMVYMSGRYHNHLILITNTLYNINVLLETV